jgi:hypothetical protein
MQLTELPSAQLDSRIGRSIYKLGRTRTELVCEEVLADLCERASKMHRRSRNSLQG